MITDLECPQWGCLIPKKRFLKGYLKGWSGFQNDKIRLTRDFLVDVSLKWPEKVEFSISVIIENCAWDKSGKNSKYNIYKIVSKRDNFINDIIFPHISWWNDAKKSKITKISQNRKLCQPTKLSKLAILKWAIFWKIHNFWSFWENVSWYYEGLLFWKEFLEKESLH